MEVEPFLDGFDIADGDIGKDSTATAAVQKVPDASLSPGDEVDPLLPPHVPVSRSGSRSPRRSLSRTKDKTAKKKVHHGSVSPPPGKASKKDDGDDVHDARSRSASQKSAESARSHTAEHYTGIADVLTEQLKENPATRQPSP